MPYNKEFSLEYNIRKARKIISKTGNDSFYIHNNDTLVVIGTVIMWVSLCHIFSGF